MFLKDFVKKFNKPTISSSEENANLEAMKPHEVVKPQVETISSAAIIDIKDLRIKALEHQIELLKEKVSKEGNPKKKRYAKIKNVVIEVFDQAEKELNAKEVLERMEKTKLRNKKPGIASVRSSIESLRQAKILKDGKKWGTYSLKKISR